MWRNGSEQSRGSAHPLRRGAETTTRRLYRVVDGDTLHSVAERFYGDPIYWPAVYSANRGMIDDSGHLSPGMVLHIPNLDLE